MMEGMNGWMEMMDGRIDKRSRSPKEMTSLPKQIGKVRAEEKSSSCVQNGRQQRAKVKE